jgi:hypothetical protein
MEGARGRGQGMDDDRRPRRHLWQEWWQSRIMELRILAAQLRAETQALRRDMRSHRINQVGTPGEPVEFPTGVKDVLIVGVGE